MIVGYRPLPAAGGDHGYVRRFGQFDEGVFRIGARHAAACVYQRKVRFDDEARGLAKLFGAGHDSRDGGRVAQFDFLALHPGISGNLEEDGAGTAGAHLPERLSYGVGNIAGPEHLPPPLGDGAHHVGLIDNFMHGAQVLADALARNLALNHENGRGARVCGRHAGGGVVKPHPRNHQGHSRFSRDAGIASAM